MAKKSLGAGVGVWIAVIIIVAIVAASGGYYSGFHHGVEAARALPPSIGVGVLISNVHGGMDVLKGIEVAAKHINDTGGLAARNIVLLVRGTQGDPSIAKSALQELIDRGVEVVIAALSDSEVEAVAPMLREHEVTMLLISRDVEVNSPSVDEGNMIFRVTDSYELQGRAMADLAIRIGAMKAAILAVNDTYGLEISSSLAEHYEALGGQIVYKACYSPVAVNVSSQLNTIKALKPNVVFLVGHSDDAVKILRMAMNMSLTVQWIMPSELANEELFTETGLAGYIEGSYVIHVLVNKESQAYREFEGLYREVYGEEPSDLSAFGYDALMLMSVSLAYAGQYNGTAVKYALFQVGKLFNGITGQKAFDENGNAMQAFEVLRVLYDHVSGKLKLKLVGYWTPKIEGGAAITWILSS